MSLAEGITQLFNSQFAAWVRIEPRCRQNDISRGVEAHTADALWFLTRQWQMGEFQGEDAGSPIGIQMQYSRQPLTDIAINGETYLIDTLPDPYQDSTSQPLELLVERESTSLNWRERISLGQRFERMVRGEFGDAAPTLIEGFRKSYGLQCPSGDLWTETDLATRRLLEFMQGRVVDGKPLLEMADTDSPLPLEDSPADVMERVRSILKNLKKTRSRICSQPFMSQPSPWRSQNLEYRFSLNTDDSIPPGSLTRLSAPDYRNGDCDWHNFLVDGNIQKTWPKTGSFDRTPTHIRIGGASLRWWGFEDATLNFGALDAAKPDLAKLLLMEFVLIYGDDWYSTPIPVPNGQLVAIDSLKVTNVFGEESDLNNARILDPDPEKTWDVFSLSRLQNPNAGSAANALFIPPVAGFRQESKPIEELHFLRDEGANMVWAVEKIVQNGMGNPADGFEAQLERVRRRNEVQISLYIAQLDQINARLSNDTLSDQDGENLTQQAAQLQASIERLKNGPYTRQFSPQGSAPQFHLASAVPENWFPFVPHNYSTPEWPIIRLQRASMLRDSGIFPPDSIPAMTQMLDNPTQSIVVINEEAVLRDGLRILLTHQRVRWADGSIHVWLGRSVLVGSGEGSSGLKFDFIQ